MKKLIVSFVSAAALATIGMAAAGGSTAAYDNSASSTASTAGIFISGNVGYSRADFNKNDFNSSSVSLKKGDFAWNGNVGYQFNQYLAVEAGYMNFGDTKASLTGSTTNKVKLDGFTADVKGMYPVNSQFDVFGKAGAVRMVEDQSISTGSTALKVTDTRWVPELGVGTSYNINNNVAMSLQDIYTFKSDFTKNSVKGNVPSTNSILLGASYKFTM